MNIKQYSVAGNLKLSVDVYGFKISCNHSRTKRNIIVNRSTNPVSTVLKREPSTDSAIVLE